MCIAMGAYMFGCLLAGVAQSIVALIIFRGIAGAGGGGIVSVMQIVISDVVSLRDRSVFHNCSKMSTYVDDTYIFQRKVSRNYWRCHQLRIRLGSSYRRNTFPESHLASKLL